MWYPIPPTVRSSCSSSCSLSPRWRSPLCTQEFRNIHRRKQLRELALMNGASGRIRRGAAPCGVALREVLLRRMPLQIISPRETLITADGILKNSNALKGVSPEFLSSFRPVQLPHLTEAPVTAFSLPSHNPCHYHLIIHVMTIVLSISSLPHYPYHRRLIVHVIPSSLAPPLSSGTVKDVEIVCFACGEPGHKDYQCPKEKLQLFNAKVGGGWVWGHHTRVH